VGTLTFVFHRSTNQEIEPMASDQQVSARDVLRALARLRRQGIDEAMRELEALEPDLASFVMEEFSLVYRDLLALGGSPKRSRRAQRRVQDLVVVSVLALREAHHRLWQASTAGTPLERLADDSEDDGEQPPKPRPH
jgi:hypothetical protein